MPGCSKAPRGLFVLSRATCIFTGTSISPGPLARQRSSRYSIRAGRNLPDKEFRYLRTVIVTAAVYWGFGSRREAVPFTVQHWAGVSPYTAPCGFAETCVFGKQSLEPIRCSHPRLLACASHPPVAPLLPKLRGQFAEFLTRGSPVHLPSLLGAHLRRSAVRAHTHSLEAFPGGPGPRDSIAPSRNLAPPLPCPRERARRAFPPRAGLQRRTHPVQSVRSPCLSASPPRSNMRVRDWITHQLSIAYALRPRLRPA